MKKYLGLSHKTKKLKRKGKRGRRGEGGGKGACRGNVSRKEVRRELTAEEIKVEE
jgi:hypothetical protein